MEELEERINRAVEGILGNESLTADLDDDAAKVLIEWGMTCVNQIAQSVTRLDAAEAEKIMSSRLRAIRRLMRSVNKWIGNWEETDANGHTKRLSKVLEQAAIIYGERLSQQDEDRCGTLLKHLDSMEDPAQMIADLRRFLTDPSFSPPGGERWSKKFARSLSQLPSSQ
jgi:uncharacterized membrane-anchored protein YjiN (DUF445 family)